MRLTDRVSSRAKRALDIVSTVLAIAAAIGVLWRSYGSYLTTYEKPVATVSDVIPAAKLRHAQGGGRVALVEFSDYSCQYCGRFMRETFPSIQKEYVAPRLVTYIAFAYPLGGRLGEAAAGVASECAGLSAQFWSMRQLLFDEPWRRLPDELTLPAVRLGIDGGRFRECILSGVAVENLRRDYEEGRRLGVSSTPTFFAGYVGQNGDVKLVSRIKGAQRMEVFRGVLDHLLSL